MGYALIALILWMVFLISMMDDINPLEAMEYSIVTGLSLVVTVHVFIFWLFS